MAGKGAEPQNHELVSSDPPIMKEPGRDLEDTFKKHSGPATISKIEVALGPCNTDLHHSLHCPTSGVRN